MLYGANPFGGEPLASWIVCDPSFLVEKNLIYKYVHVDLSAFLTQKEKKSRNVLPIL